MDVFELRDNLTSDYSQYVRSFINIHDDKVKNVVELSLQEEQFWPAPLIQLNPSFETGGTVRELIDLGLLHPECSRIFQRNKAQGSPQALRLHRHQREAIEIASAGYNYMLTTGTGSGKSLAYVVPIVDHVLRRGSGGGIQAIVVYPMNALANSQMGELRKFLVDGYPDGGAPVTFARYTGQETEEERRAIIAHPPDILLTNYVMLELIMTRPRERQLVERAKGLRFLVLDELHTYRGRQGADVALLMRRVRNRLETRDQRIMFIGTSATLATEGSHAERRAQVAEVSSQIFGVPVEAEHVIGETLHRATHPYDNAEAFKRDLRDAVQAGAEILTTTQYDSFVAHPLSIWIEDNFGLTEVDGRLERQQPRSIAGEEGAARALASFIGVDEITCEEAIQRWLLAGYQCDPNPETGFAPFAFRLHQFISPGDTVYASVEVESTRYITLSGQHFVPGERERVLFPVCFCRECGQEYFVVRKSTIDESSSQFVPREFGDRLSDAESEAGYLYIGSHKPWPTDVETLLSGDYLPDDWLEERNGVKRIRAHRRDKLPHHLHVRASGEEAEDGLACVYVPSPFMFCLNCGVAYDPRQGDFAKLATLSSEGRSSATTLLSLSAIRSLKETDLPLQTQKLLSFTDNRQDASLQAGHFNDFIEVSLLRGAIYRAAASAGKEGLAHEIIAEKVFEALDLPIELYASNPEVRFQALQETQRAMRQVLGYRIYRDLRRGWRIALPNLEQCGLLEIGYADLEAVCYAEDVWHEMHPALATASPATRMKIAKTFLDYMRRELAIKVDYLESGYQERIQQLSSQRLKEPWAIDEDERMEYAWTLVPRSSGGDSGRGNYKYVSGRGGFGIYLRRPGTFREYRGAAHERLSLDETEQVIRNLLEGLRVAGLVEITREPEHEGDVPGYQLVASAMRWYAGDGTRAFHDPIRVPRESEAGGLPNPFFVEFYRSVAGSLLGMIAKEHTAQVPYDEREKRENRFRTGELPILYCSPTMELGVDIAELNVVNLRNVPPTPANYAQRSGRAGRSGQPALVFTYCSSGSPHDQYFFKRPQRMVAGAVSPPRLDLTNEELLRAHIHAIWLAETGIDLQDTLKEILDMNGDPPGLELLPEIREQAESKSARSAAYYRAEQILRAIPEVPNAAELLDVTMANVVQNFDQTCARWRGLYLSALRQVKAQEEIRRDPTRSSEDKRRAERQRREALSQIDLLTEVKNLAQSDFYSYRYFAAEGFLPGYSFPRLPISAFIPARRVQQRDEFLSRPRFLAISEFGPRAIIYHEGSRYLIDKVIMPVSDDEEGPLTTQIKQCGYCGYVHPIKPHQDYDLCQRCGMPLNPPMRSLLKLQNVGTRRRDRINADEEERLRLGYDIRTGVRFSEREGRLNVRTAGIQRDGVSVASLTYAQSATLWRINLGWTRRQDKSRPGFVLDIERGVWGRNEQNADDLEDPLSESTRRVIPYVEDNRNCLLLEPANELAVGQMASLQAALKRAIEAVYQLEDNELAAEPLPDSSNRQIILLYEAAEGGAGVLRRLVDDADALRQVAREALSICHFDPDTGQDLRRAPRAREDCEAACYDCLLSYANQREHPILDRQSIRDLLIDLANAEVISSPSSAPRETHLDMLSRLCDSDLEREWLVYLNEHGLRLPDQPQVYIQDCETRPDFLYTSGGVYAAVYIDGSYHDYPHRQARDAQQTECMADYGYRVIRFGYRDDWDTILSQNGHIFGVAK
ncbi:MAG: DEAD/DEAH box helicase [Anaerolineae bacterium]|nr:DEAD/DEAH box helicase [Anaerolineae bacterium]